MSTNIPVKKVTNDASRSSPEFAELDSLQQRIRARAYDICAHGGFRWGRDLEDWLQAERELSWPAMELTEDEHSYRLNVAVAGFVPDQIGVTATSREIVVRAVSKKERASTPQDTSATTVRWSELSERQLCRRVVLPAAVDPNEVTASLRDGMLTVKAEKHAAAESKKPSVAAAA